VLDWNPQGTRKTKEDLEEVSYWRGTQRRKDVEGGEGLAADRGRWKSFVEALCSYTGDHRKWWWRHMSDPVCILNARIFVAKNMVYDA
jgi:hypothetical protein